MAATTIKMSSSIRLLPGYVGSTTFFSSFPLCIQAVEYPLTGKNNYRLKDSTNLNPYSVTRMK